MENQKMEHWKKNQEKRIQDVILRELLKLRDQKVTFDRLFNECRKRKPTLSRVTLTKHLKILMETKVIEKTFDTEYIKGFYQIKEKGMAKIIVESWIQHLGTVATHFIVRTKLNKPIDVSHDIFYEINQYLKEPQPRDEESSKIWKEAVGFVPESVSWEELFNYLQEKEKYRLSTREW